ncbi:MAG: integrase [Sphingomonadales bacterium]|nr:integrase [Sphingomonadales bacterium]
MPAKQTNTSIVVHLNRIVHQQQPWWKLSFNFDIQIITRIKSLAGRRWSAMHRSWLLPYEQYTEAQLSELLNGCVILCERSSGPLPDAVNLEGTENPQRLAVETFSRWLRSQRYSVSTIKTYTEALTVYLRYFGNLQPEQLDAGNLLQFNNDYILKNGYSLSYQNQVINAVKLFYGKVLGQNMVANTLERPRRGMRLPHVLSEAAVKMILQRTTNLKHLNMLKLTYGCGLRCGEVLALKWGDIDWNRSVLWIRSGKGNRDRMVPLPHSLQQALQQYRASYQTETFVFEGQTRGTPYDARSFQLVFKQACKRARVGSEATLHWLRHSYATHLLEQGTDLRYIQVLLGHRSSKTTELYTWITKPAFDRLKSPIDNLGL